MDMQTPPNNELEQEIVSSLFIAGQWSGNSSDPARLILSYIGYVHGEGPVLNALVQEAKVGDYVDEATRQNLLNKMFSGLGINNIQANHGLIEKIPGREMLAVYFFPNPNGFSAETCLDACVREMQNSPSPIYYLNEENRHTLKAYSPIGGVIMVAPVNSAPREEPPREDTMGLNRRYQTFHLMSARYNSQQANPGNENIRIIQV